MVGLEMQRRDWHCPGNPIPSGAPTPPTLDHSAFPMYVGKDTQKDKPEELKRS